LSKDVPDDFLLATAIEFAGETQGRDVVVVCADIGLYLKAKSQIRIGSLFLNEDLRLPEEMDASEKRVKELEKEIRKYSSMMPVLSLSFENQARFMTFVMSSPEALREDKLVELMSKVEEEYPLLPEEESGKAFLLPGGMGVSPVNYPNRSYNNELKQFYAGMRSYLKAVVEHINLRKRTLEIGLIVNNVGSAPAENVDIDLHFPNGFLLSEKQPKRPMKPTPPVTGMERLRQSILPNFDLADLNRRISQVEISNVSLVGIKKTQSYDVNVNVRRLKHLQSDSIQTFFLTFDSFEAAGSFAIEYRIIADNAPEPFLGSLNCVIEKT